MEVNPVVRNRRRRQPPCLTPARPAKPQYLLPVHWSRYDAASSLEGYRVRRQSHAGSASEHAIGVRERLWHVPYRTSWPPLQHGKTTPLWIPVRPSICPRATPRGLPERLEDRGLCVPGPSGRIPARLPRTYGDGRSGGELPWLLGKQPMHYPRRISKIKRARTQGFRARMRTHKGRNTISRKRRHGCHRVSVC